LIFGALQTGINIDIADLETSTFVDFLLYHGEQMQKAKADTEKTYSTSEMADGGI
jgi:hypothetical protein